MTANNTVYIRIDFIMVNSSPLSNLSSPTNTDLGDVRIRRTHKLIPMLIELSVSVFGKRPVETIASFRMVGHPPTIGGTNVTYRPPSIRCEHVTSALLLRFARSSRSQRERS